MTNAIEKYEKAPLVPSTFPNATELDLMGRIAKLMVASGFFGSDKTGDPASQMGVAMLAGREMGLGPFASIQGIHIVHGKPQMSANLLATKVASHPRYDYNVKALTNEKCAIEFLRDGKPIGVSEFTLQDAKTAGLTTGTNSHTWKNYARNMLFARAMSNGVRWYCPDVTGGSAVYVPGELDDEVVVDSQTGEVVSPPQNDEKHPRRPAQPATEDVSLDDVPAVSIDPNADNSAVTADECGKFVERWRELDKQGGPCTDNQWRYIGNVVIDDITGQTTHKDVLSLMLGRTVNGDNPPSFACAKALFDALLETKVEKDEDGNKVREYPNPDYDPKAVNCIRRQHAAVMAAKGQQTLLEEAES